MVAAAAKVFEQDGYYGTDSNRIARAAGYAPGTFYKHFDDKAEIFLAAYDAWVAEEWLKIERLAVGPGDRRVRIGAVVDFLVEHHRRSSGLRATLRVLVQLEPRVRRHHHAVRARQVMRFEALRPDTKPGDAGLLLLFVERVCDALADKEAPILGIDEATAKRAMVDRLLGE